MKSHFTQSAICCILLFSLSFKQTFSQTTFSPLSPALGFNVFVKNDLTLTAGDTHGPAACGANVVLNGSSILSMNSTGSYPFGAGNSSNYGLVIGGKVVYTSGNSSYVNQGYLRIGNTTGSTLYYKDNNNASCNLRLTSGSYNNSTRLELQRQQATGTATDPANINFTSAFTLLNSYATKINAYNTTSSCASYLNKIIIPNISNPHIQLQANKINYIYLTGAQLTNLNSLGSIIFDQAPSATRLVVFNIAAAGTYNWTTPNFAGLSESDGAYILWNFYNTTSLTLGGGNSIYGTVFAPQAAISKTGANNNNGQIIGSSLVNAYGEIHYFPFTANLPDCPSGGPLPLKTGFDLSAQLKDGQITIVWSDFNRLVNSSYDIEKSIDGVNFNALATVLATNDLRYNYADNIISSNNTQLYYRIKITGKDGTTLYSDVIAIKLSVANNVKAWPNPFVKSINLSYNSTVSAFTQIQLTDIAGRIIKNYSFDFKKGINQVNLEGISNLVSGNYFVRITQAAGNDATVLKILK